MELILFTAILCCLLVVHSPTVQICDQWADDCSIINPFSPLQGLKIAVRHIHKFNKPEFHFTFFHESKWKKQMPK